MGFVDGAGSVTFSGLRWDATGVVAAVAVQPTGPSSGDSIPATLVPLHVVVDNNGGTNTDVQVQVATDAAFSSIASAPSSSNVVNGPLVLDATGLTSGTTYYWRARGAPTGTTAWGPWSATWTFKVDVNTGRGYGYIMENVGVNPATAYKGNAEYIVENIGIIGTLYKGGIDYSFENVGIVILLDPDAADYVFEGDVSTNTPTPHIWFLRPDSARPGDTVVIVGFGFGDLQTTYDGVPYLNPGPSGVKESLGVVAWQTFPPTDDAYTAERTLDEVTFVIDMQHQTITVAVPPDAEPPGYPLIVETDGP